jgi:hypothetical protein
MMFIPPWRFGRAGRRCMTRLSKTVSRERAADCDGDGVDVSEIDDETASERDADLDTLGDWEGEIDAATPTCALFAVAV